MTVSCVLLGAAFGPEPGRHPLPPAHDARTGWWRAVALGGQGRYAGAAAELERLGSASAAPELRSLAASTRASHLRQLGGHALARRLDAGALLLAVGVGGGAGASARCDALVGLAADALGPGRVALARRLLERAEPGLAAADGRCAVRWHWVAAETALCAGEPEVARGHAASAHRLAADGASVRHRVKSVLVEAAASGSAVSAEQARSAAAEHGLVPLRWAATMLLLSLGVTRSGDPAGGSTREENTASHAMLTRWGAVLPGTPLPLEQVRRWWAHPATATGDRGPRAGAGSPERGQGRVRVVR